MGYVKAKILPELPFKQGSDPTNCVLYCYANFLGSFDEMEPFRKTEDGHDKKEDFLLLNRLGVYASEAFLFPVADNAGSEDGLSLKQVERALADWDSYFNEDHFYPIFIDVFKYHDGKSIHHRIVAFKTKNDLVLCDPKDNNFLSVNADYLFHKYTRVESVNVVGFVAEQGVATSYFNKSDFKHIPF